MIQAYSAFVGTALLGALWAYDQSNIQRATRNIEAIDDDIDRATDWAHQEVREDVKQIHRYTRQGFQIQRDLQNEFINSPWYNRVFSHPPRPDEALARRYAEDRIQMEKTHDCKDLHRIEMTKIKMHN